MSSTTGKRSTEPKQTLLQQRHKADAFSQERADLDRLANAAPALLAAAKAAVEFMIDTDETRCNRDALIAAINQAEGRNA